MKDATRAMREMYINGLAAFFPVYDGMAPTDTVPLYGIITATSFTKLPIKMANAQHFTVTLEIYQEFNEVGNSEGVDAAAEQVLQVMIPLNSKLHLPISGFSNDDVVSVSGRNDTGAMANKAFAVFRKVLNITHAITEQ